MNTYEPAHENTAGSGRFGTIKAQPRPQGLLLVENRRGEGPGDEVGSRLFE